MRQNTPTYISTKAGHRKLVSVAPAPHPKKPHHLSGVKVLGGLLVS
jgi:hypothetical protein